jgi:hypothetical protein
MAGKNNNKTLLVVLVILLAVFLFGKFFRQEKRANTLKSNGVELDTSLVTKINLYPVAEKGNVLNFYKKGETWRVKKGDVDAPVEKEHIQNLLTEAKRIKPRQLVAKSKDKWIEYHVDDSLGTRVQFLSEKKKLMDLYIGKFTYKQMQSPYGGQQGGNIVGTSYYRKADEKEVYATEGFLSFTFNQDFNSWRDQQLIQLNKKDVTRLNFDYFADSSFTVQKADSVWLIGSIKADSLKIDNYLDKLRNQRKSVFKDDFHPGSQPACQLTIEGNNMNTIVLKAYNDNGVWIFNSSFNPESYFADPDKSLVHELLITKEDLFSN